MPLRLMVFALFVLGQSLPAQTVHQFSGIKVLPDKTISLTLTGSVPTPEIFGQYFQQYVIEASTNLVDWFPLVTLQQTNQPTTALTFQDKAAAQSERRFYRTHTNHFITQLPQPTGPYALGTFSRLLTDPSRMDAERGTKRQFMVTFWYPAIAKAGLLPSPYVDLELAQNVTRNGRLVDRISQFFSHSFPSAPLATNQMAYPVVLYSPHLGAHRRQNTDKTEELASQGYIVVAIDHRDIFMSVFPDGEVVFGPSLPRQDLNDPNYVAFILSTIQERIPDMQFLFDELGRLNAGDPFLGGHLDLERVGAFGLGVGGSTVAELCRVDIRCRASANMIGSFWVPEVLEHGLTRPFMIFRNDPTDPQYEYSTDDRRKVFERLEANAYWVRIAQSLPVSFAENGLILEPWALHQFAGAPPPEQQTSGVRFSQITRAYLVSFFNKYLKNQDDHLLDGPPADYPEVKEFLKK